MKRKYVALTVLYTLLLYALYRIVAIAGKSISSKFIVGFMLAFVVIIKPLVFSLGCMFGLFILHSIITKVKRE